MNRRKKLTTMLSICTEAQKHQFKRMYSPWDLKLPIDEVIENMSTLKIDWAIKQVRNTLEHGYKTN